MKVRWVGSYDPDFSRNIQLRRLFERCGADVLERPHRVWPTDRQTMAGAQKPIVAARMLVNAVRMLVGLLIEEAPDVYFCSYPGAFDIPVLRIVSKLKRRPLVFDAFISLYDTVVSDRRLIASDTLLARTLCAVDRWSVRMSDVVVVDTPEHAEFFAELAGDTLSKFIVVRVGADEEVFRPVPSVAEVDGLVVFYGTYVPLQSVSTIIEAAARLESEAITFRLIGDGQDRSGVEAQIESLGLANVTLVDGMPLSALNDEIQRAQVVLGIFGAGDKAQRVVPHKVYEACAAGRALISAESPAIRTAFEEGELVTVPPEDAEALANEILRLVKDEDLREALAERGRNRYLKSFSVDELASDLQMALDRAVR